MSNSGGEDVFPASPGSMIGVWLRVVTRSLGGAEDKMSLRIMWLPLRYKEVNYIPWFIIWKLKTHSFSNLIPPPMEQCSLWAKLANNVTNSDADVISIRGAAARGDERVPDGSLPLLSPRLDNSPAVVIITWAIKEGEAVLPCFSPHTPSHLILHLIVFLSFPVSLRLEAADTALFDTGKTEHAEYYRCETALTWGLLITCIITAAFCNTKKSLQ